MLKLKALSRKRHGTSGIIASRTKCTVSADAEFKDTKHLKATASYVVAKDGRIVEARITKTSRNARFDTIVLTAINSLDGQFMVPDVRR
ncbi:MAG: TonB C-terminal domain-containing protein [Cyanobacteria bacterium SZAS-4]|nr:TonB C-terminal domain-containing protein [Cyanobacteria bacterium SZAS-4]